MPCPRVPYDFLAPHLHVVGGSGGGVPQERAALCLEGQHRGWFQALRLKEPGRQVPQDGRRRLLYP